MNLETLAGLFDRELEKLSVEISSFKVDSNRWTKVGSVSNSAGNLTLHLIGNLNHFIGATLGNSGYVRERDLEFSTEYASEEFLQKRISDTRLVVAESFKMLSPSQLSEIYPVQKWDKEWTTEHLLLHLLTHLSYHIGQINYLRRTLE